MANIKFNNFETDIWCLNNAELAQGLPLLPILFAFFNADLVDQPMNIKGEASIYIDNYFC